jgi:predicted PurR-regulated permease PerM
MKDQVFKKYSKYLFLGLFLILIMLAFLVVKSFITSILTSIVLSYLFYPIYKKLNELIKNKSISSLVMVILLLMIIVIPTFFLINSLLNESLLLYNYVKALELSLSPEILNALNKVIQYFVTEASSSVLEIPKFLVHAFVTMFLFYYFLRDGERLVKDIKSLIPMTEKHKEHVVNEFKNVTHAIVYGLILTGIIEGLAGALGFYIFDVKSPLFWGFIMMILTILPGIGTSFVWAPAAIIKIIQGDLFNGICLFIYGFIFISGMEAILKPKFIGRKSNIHPALIVIGVFGGIQLLGFIGLFFGPLVLVIFITFLKSILNRD